MNNAPAIDDYRDLIEIARREDLGAGDVTSEATIPVDQQGKARLVFRQPGRICGLVVIEHILRNYDEQLRLECHATDGQAVALGTCVAIISGPLRSLLAAERVVLNFLQRLSGVTTQTAHYVERIEGTNARICDTRKTTPGWRVLEKYAVRCGGGLNHRHGLFDAVLIKDNHLAALGAENLRAGLLVALQRIEAQNRPVSFVQVEVDTLDQLDEIIDLAGVDMILLDNMTLDEMAQAVRRRNQRRPEGDLLLEASGGITFERVRDVALTGVDRISVGALTHQVKSLDIGLDLA